MHVKNQEIISCAKTWIDILYRHQGRSRHAGIDCAGLIICVAKELGISTFDTKAYPRIPNIIEFNRQMEKGGCRMIPFTDRANGDILRIAELRWPVHSGLLEIDRQGKEWLIHSWRPARKVIREVITKLRFSQISSVWRYPEIV